MVNRGDAHTTIAFQYFSCEPSENITFGTFFSSHEWFLLTLPKIESSIENNGPMVEGNGPMNSFKWKCTFCSQYYFLWRSSYCYRFGIGDQKSETASLGYSFLSSCGKWVFWASISRLLGSLFGVSSQSTCTCTYHMAHTWIQRELPSRHRIKSINPQDLDENLSLIFSETSICRLGLSKNVRVKVLEISLFAQKLSHCLEAEQFVFLLFSSEYKLTRCYTCIAWPEFLMNHAVHLSPPLGSSHDNYANKLRLELFNQQNIVHLRWGYRKSKEFSLMLRFRSSSKNLRVSSWMKNVWPRDVPTSFSDPVTLSIEYFLRFIYLHLSIIIIASFTFVLQGIRLHFYRKKS